MKYWLIALAMIAFYPVSSIAQTDTKHAVGARIICSLSDTGDITCASDGAYTRLQPPSDIPSLTSIVAGDVHVCGLTSDGSAICWGDNNFGQTQVPADEKFISLNAGVNLTCGITTDNRALCWGLNSHGEAEPPPDDLFSDVAADLTSTCGLTLDGQVICWGQFNLAERYGDEDIFTTLVLNDENTCGLTDSNAIRCKFESTVPAGNNMIDLAMTKNLICGLQASGDISCTTTDITEDWLPHLAASVEEINDGPDVLSLYGGVGATRMCYTTVNSTFGCLVRENRGNPPLPDQEPPSLDAPRNLSADVYSETTVELFWVQDNSTTGGADIYRNGELLAYTRNGRSYIDSTLTPGIDYEYSVITYAFNGRRSPESISITVNTAPDTGEMESEYSPIARPMEPTDLRFKKYSSRAVELFWNRPDSVPANFNGYEIRRNHSFYAFTRGVSFYDIIEVGSGYHYDVVPVSRDGSILGFSGIDVK